MLQLPILKAWALSVMLFLVPSAPWRSSYEASAEAIAENAISSPLFKDDDGRRTAAILISVAFFEGTFKPNAEGDHECLRRESGHCVKLDQTKPHSFCMFQINDTNFGSLGVTREQLQTDIRVCTSTALRMMKMSFHNCSGMSLEDRLNWYVMGQRTCPAKVPMDKGQHRIRKGMWIYNHRPLLPEHLSAGGEVTSFLTDTDK